MTVTNETPVPARVASAAAWMRGTSRAATASASPGDAASADGHREDLVRGVALDRLPGAPRAHPARDHGGEHHGDDLQHEQPAHQPRAPAAPERPGCRSTGRSPADRRAPAPRAQAWSRPVLVAESDGRARGSRRARMITLRHRSAGPGAVPTPARGPAEPGGSDARDGADRAGALAGSRAARCPAQQGNGVVRADASPRALRRTGHRGTGRHGPARNRRRSGSERSHAA